MLACATDTRAEFVLNWSQDTPFPTFSGTNVIHGSAVIQNQTPFIYERVISTEGVAYYHMVVGDPDAGFAQEVYIQAPQSNVGNFFGGIGPQQSASGGATGGGSNPGDSNAADPLNASLVVGGNASGNPERVQMRQILNDGELSLDFQKDLSGKPVISNIVENERQRAEFVIDGSELSYDDSDTAARVTNSLQIFDPDIPVESALFDLDLNAQDSTVTAGRYQYVPGAGVGGSGGTYEYIDGGINAAPDWSIFFDSREVNPWSYPVNRPDTTP